MGHQAYLRITEHWAPKHMIVSSDYAAGANTNAHTHAGANTHADAATRAHTHSDTRARNDVEWSGGRSTARWAGPLSLPRA